MIQTTLAPSPFTKNASKNSTYRSQKDNIEKAIDFFRVIDQIGGKIATKSQRQNTKPEFDDLKEYIPEKHFNGGRRFTMFALPEVEDYLTREDGTVYPKYYYRNLAWFNRNQSNFQTLTKNYPIDFKKDIFFTPNLYRSDISSTSMLERIKTDEEVSSIRSRSQENVKYLTCLYVDMDNLSVQESLEIVSNSDIPKPTMAVSSGKGTHLYWVFNYKILYQHYSRNYSKLIKFFQSELGGDPKACNASRLLRVPGSFNAKRNSTVTLAYHNGPLYSFMDLKEKYIGKAVRKYTKQDKAIKNYHSNYRAQYRSELPNSNKQSFNHSTNSAGRKSAQSLTNEQNFWNKYNSDVILDIYKLSEIRQGIKPGYWNSVLFILKCMGLDDNSIKDFNKNHINLPLTDSEIKTITSRNKHYKLKTLTKSRIISELDITIAEQQHLKQLRYDYHYKHQSLSKKFSKLFNLSTRYYRELFIHSTDKKDKRTNKEKAQALYIKESRYYSIQRQVKSKGVMDFNQDKMLGEIRQLVKEITVIYQLLWQDISELTNKLNLTVSCLADFHNLEFDVNDANGKVLTNLVMLITDYQNLKTDLTSLDSIITISERKLGNRINRENIEEKINQLHSMKSVNPWQPELTKAVNG